MPRFERTTLMGYLVEARRGRGAVPDETGVLVDVEVTELVFTDEFGDQVVFPMTDEMRQQLLAELTGGIVVPGNGRTH